MPEFYVKQLEYGMHVPKLTNENLLQFITNIPMYAKNLENYNQDENIIFFNTLEDKINSLK